MIELVAFCISIFILAYDVSGNILPLWSTAVMSLGLFITYIVWGIRRAGLGLLNLSVYFLVLYFTVSIEFWIRLLNIGVYYISRHSMMYQTDALLARASQLSTLGLASFGLAWIILGHKRLQRVALPLERRGLPDHMLAFAFQPARFWITLFLAVGLLFVVSPRETILQVDYFTAIKSGSTFGLNILRPAAYMLILYAQLMCFQAPTRLRWLVWIGIAGFGIVYAGFLAGNRVEAIGLGVGIGIIWQWQRRRTWSVFSVLIIGLLGILFLQILGATRSSFYAEGFDLSDVFRAGSSNTVVSTQGDVAITTLVTLGLFQDELLDYDYGMTFINIFLSTFPESLTPNRPISFAWRIGALASIGGGTFVLNEPFMAGGALGVVIALFGLGWVIGYLEFSAKKPVDLILYLIVVASLSRFVYYGWLSLYKYLLTGIIVYLASYLLSAAFVKDSANSSFVKSAIKS